jgi:glycosyltransferase involved in cell wall biosynthesis
MAMLLGSDTSVAPKVRLKRASLSIIIAARNEELHIRQTASDLLRVARQSLESFEIILVDDGSSDQTGKIMDELALQSPEFKIVHHPQCLGMGAVFQSGLQRAGMEKMLLLPGDSAYNAESLAPYFQRSGETNIVIGTRSNLDDAVTPGRLAISRLYRRMICLFFGLSLEDIHGPCIFPCAAVRAAGVRSSGITFQMETLVKLIWSGLSVSQVPVRLNVNGEKSSRSFNWKSFESLGRTVLHLLSVRNRFRAPGRTQPTHPRLPA